MIHFEIFSPGGDAPIIDAKDKMGWTSAEDTDANGFCDVDALLKKMTSTRTA